jgi:sugar phosphate permease
VRSIPRSLLIPIIYFTLPESVKFLALAGRADEIKTILSRVRPQQVVRYRDAQIAGFLSGLVCGYASDRHGSRRGMIVTWWSLGAGSVFTLVFLNSHLINLCFVTAAGFFIIGGQFVLNNFTANVYETRVRATAVGMELSVGRVGEILGPWVTGLLQEHYSGSTAMFLAITVAALIAALAMARARVENQFVGYKAGATFDGGLREKGAD